MAIVVSQFLCSLFNTDLPSSTYVVGQRIRSRAAMYMYMFGLFETLHLSKSKKEAFDDAVEDYIAHGLRTLSTVDDASFVKLFKTVEPRYSVPTRNTVVSRLRKRYEAMTLQLSALLLNFAQ